MTTADIFILLALGLGSGILGGLLGIGGSIIMIPALTILLGPNQHLYQAAAMMVNVVVAAAATLRHHRANAVRWDVVWRMLPIAIILIIVGVAASDAMDGRVLQRIFACFLLYVIVVNVLKLRAKAGGSSGERGRITWPRTGLVATIMGFAAGLLGIGGGVLTVPLLQRVCHLPLRQCIATSSGVMCLTSIVGAIRKNMTMTEHVDMQSAEAAALTLTQSLTIAGCLAPTALLGALLGATLTHALPLKAIRLLFILLLAAATFRMLDLPL